MRFKLTFKITIVFVVFSNLLIGQNSSFQQFKKLSCPEKRWVIFHPFVAKKAFKISLEARNTTAEVKQQKVLKGTGNGDQLDAFRHAYWMARLAQEIHWRKAQRLGKAHEKGNYRQFKKQQLEDDALPDKISSEMDLFNNEVALQQHFDKLNVIKGDNGKKYKETDLINEVIKWVKEGKCKIIKTDAAGNFLDDNNKIIPIEELIGKWENRKVLVFSNY